MAFPVEASSLDHLEAFRELLAHLREPVLLVGRDRTIVAANVAVAEALGSSVGTLVGATLDAYAPAPIGDSLLRAARGEGSVHLRARDGRRLTCDASVLASDLFVVRVTGAPDAAPRSPAYFEMVARLERITAGAHRTVDELTRALLAIGLPPVGATAGGVFLVDETGSILELAGAVGYLPESVERFRLVPMTAAIPLTESVRRHEPVYLGSEVDYVAQFPAFAAAHPWIAERSMACVPLSVDGRCIGTLGLGFAMLRPFTEDDRAALLELARQCAVALHRARQIDREGMRGPSEIAATRLERLHAFTGALARAITPAEVAAAAVDAGMAAVGARSGGLWLVADDDRSVVSLVRAVGPTGPLPEQHARVPLARPDRLPVLDAILHAQPVWLESCSQIEEHYPEAFRRFSRGGESSLACVPLLAQGRCIGGLSYNYAGTHYFLEDERAFFQVLSWYAAQALERARLYAAEQEARSGAEASHRRAAFLADSDALLATLDSPATLAAVAAMCVPRIADWCIVELDEDAARGIPPVAAHVDPAKLPEVLERASGRSSLTVPIAARGRTLGTIRLGSDIPARVYDEHDLAMAEELGRKVGLAVENARLYRDVRDADRLKDEFLAMLSHELRNPLVPIVAAVELMGLREGDTFERERGLIQRNVRHLVRLVDDLLDVSRITRGKVQLRKTRCEVADLIADAVEIAYPAIENREHSLTLSAPGRGLPVLADRVRMAQAIANLLTNAAKYTDHAGSIAVTASADGSDAVIRVRDSGIGISPEILPRVFDLFVQGAGTPDRAQGGLGIGLTVVKSLVTLHGGSVTATSAGLGHGSELVVRLPLAPAESEGIPAQIIAPAGARIPTRRVLVVEDNHDAATVLGSLLQAVGCTTLVVHDGPAALAAVREFNPDLALLDLGLPFMDGYELARHLRDLDRSLRLVAVTGYGQDTDRRRTHEAGFEAHLVKPIELDVVRRIVET